MNDALVKQLKEAGLEWDSDNHDYPSLSELIEECGEDFFQLTKGSACWYAEPDIELQPPTVPQMVQGTTPEEAVARLWLSLNKKGDS